MDLLGASAHCQEILRADGSMWEGAVSPTTLPKPLLPVPMP